jgi:enhancing lycopene biosynthesis protein 2
LALVAWREVVNFKARTAVLNHLLGEKLAEQRQVEERQKELEIEQ